MRTLKDFPDNTKFRFLKGQTPAKNYITTYIKTGKIFYPFIVPHIIFKVSEYKNCKVRKVNK